MKKNNKSLPVLLIIVIILIIAILFVAWILFSKTTFSTKSSGNSFGSFKSRSADNNSAIPASLKWKDPFKEKKKKGENKPQGSYLHYLSEQNKNK